MADLERYNRFIVPRKFAKEIAELRAEGKKLKVLSSNGKRYMFAKKLGNGAYGEVYLVKEETTENYYAAKFIDKRKLNNPQYVNREIQNMRDLDHKNILKLYDSIDFGDSIYLIMEYAFHGDFHHFILTHPIIDEAMTQDCFRRIMNGVQYLHSKGIAHRDLKPQNILICNSVGIAKIADFGFSKKVGNDDEMVSMCGTRRYAAPEIFDSNCCCYSGKKADMYSLGIILKDIATKFDTQPMFPNCVPLFKKLTNRNPSLRPSAIEVLNDPWLASD